jgi:hypothetical protein
MESLNHQLDNVRGAIDEFATSFVDLTTHITASEGLNSNPALADSLAKSIRDLTGLFNVAGVEDGEEAEAPGASTTTRPMNAQDFARMLEVGSAEGQEAVAGGLTQESVVQSIEATAPPQASSVPVRARAGSYNPSGVPGLAMDWLFDSNFTTSGPTSGSNTVAENISAISPGEPLQKSLASFWQLPSLEPPLVPLDPTEIQNLSFSRRLHLAAWTCGSAILARPDHNPQTFNRVFGHTVSSHSPEWARSYFASVLSQNYQNRLDTPTMPNQRLIERQGMDDRWLDSSEVALYFYQMGVRFGMFASTPLHLSLALINNTGSDNTGLKASRILQTSQPARNIPLDLPKLIGGAYTESLVFLADGLDANFHQAS